MDFALQNKINRKMHALRVNGVDFISGTVAPAESDHDTMNIESLRKALEYFKDKGVRRLSMQPKWMGSRCQYYLNVDPTKDRAISRNGFAIKLNDEERATMRSQWEWILEYLSIAFKDQEIVNVTLDGELLPWRLVGGGLIDREFHGLTQCVETENKLLNEWGLPKVLNGILQSDDYNEYFMADREVQKKHLRHETYSQAKNLWGFTPEKELEYLQKYKVQVDLYGADGPLEYKAFDILRIDFADGSFVTEGGEGGEAIDIDLTQFDAFGLWFKDVWPFEDGWMNCPHMKFIFLSQNTGQYRPVERPWIISLHDIDVAFNTAKLYFDWLVEEGFEGTMLKPMEQFTDAVPCMKVRNPEYLRIIYGFDYDRPEKLEALVKGKRTGKKRKLSHAEHKLGKAMLNLDKRDENYYAKYEKIVKELLFNIEEEGTLDGRL